ncbi:hypothetical protein F5Y04DRAFT_285565 [Hypomontagnella monticulosa]|nr:hypothetical protein F5Y04DRAFT_285565 [Hypomontagnella monticulosa]
MSTGMNAQRGIGNVGGDTAPIKNTNINEVTGVALSPRQKVLVGSVLDLFEGYPSLSHLSLWSKSATFNDPLTAATGYDAFAAQWYGLVALFHPIKIQSHSVTSAGDPIEIKLSNKYTLKGIGMSQTIDSVVRIHIGSDDKIEKVEDRWNNKLPEGAVAEAFRKLNAKTVPLFVKVPKNEEEDAEMRRGRGD